MVKVVALDTYERLKVSDSEYGTRIAEGTEFVVSEERLKVLLGDNRFKVPFVKLAEVKEEEVEEEVKPKKRGRKKKE